MAGVRKHVRLVLAGEKLEVETNALDMVRAERDGEGPLAMGMRTVHAACLRLKLPGVPTQFDAFLGQLDDFTDLDDVDDEADADPTQATV